MKMKRFLSLLLAGTLALALTACGGSAKTDPGTSDQPSTSDENWTPKENVTMIVSYKAGSGTDNTARVLAAYAEKYIGKPVIIENLEGGSAPLAGRPSLRRPRMATRWASSTCPTSTPPSPRVWQRIPWTASLPSATM